MKIILIFSPRGGHVRRRLGSRSRLRTAALFVLGAAVAVGAYAAMLQLGGNFHTAIGAGDVVRHQVQEILTAAAGIGVEAADRVVTEAGGEDEHIVACPSVHHVVADAAGQDVVARAAIEHINAGAAIQHVRTIAAGENIVPVTAGNRVVIAGAGEISGAEIGQVLHIRRERQRGAVGEHRVDAAEQVGWTTMEEMTGTLADQLAGRNPFATTAQPFAGGIQTQFVGPQPGRARIRANKVPAINPALPCPLTAGSQGCTVTQSPTRYIRVVVRSLCAPASTGTQGAAGAPVPSTNLDNGPFFDINGPRAILTGSGPGTSGVDGSNGTCLQSAQFANGLFTGQYLAPVGEFIFGENTLAGDPIIPANIWQLGFLVYGEGGDGSTAPQVPSPW